MTQKSEKKAKKIKYSKKSVEKNRINQGGKKSPPKNRINQGKRINQGRINQGMSTVYSLVEKG